MLPALLTALVLGAAACGGDAAETPSAAPSDTGAAGGSEAGGSEAASGDLGLAEEGTLVVGSDINFEPFEFVEDGENKGFDIELMNEIASRLGLEVEYVNTSFDTIFTQLAAGDFDAIISAITITEEREQTIAFSDPYFAANQAIAAPADSDIAGPEDLAGLDVGVQAGTTGLDYATENFTEATIQEFPTSDAAFTALGAGQIDAVFIDLPVVAAQAEADDAVVLAAEVDTDERYGIGVQQDNTALVEAINTQLEAIIADGTYEELYGNWFEGDVPDEFAAG
jgi:polar amino acid transport system substrate-binding protein